MIGERAKILSLDHVEDLLVFAGQTRHPIRNQARVLLSVKAGLRAGEIANLTWPMVADPIGEVGLHRQERQRPGHSHSSRAARGFGQAGPVQP
jgi:integrase/recombinase XerD